MLILLGAQSHIHRITHIVSPHKTLSLSLSLNALV